MNDEEILIDLVSGQRWRLGNLDAAGIEPRPGIYALWYGQRLLYVGIARVDPRETNNPQARGVPGRLNTYVRSRLTSDFAIAAAFRFVVPTLSANDMNKLASGDLTVRDMQQRVREWTHNNVEVSVVLAPGDDAVRVETVARSTGLPGVGPPEFNPK